MFFRPILSDDIPKYENQRVAIIGKIIEVKYERKYTKIKVLDMDGYIDCITFEPVSFDEFKTVLILGNIKKYRNEYNLYIKRFVYLDEKDEIFWRKKFMEFINNEYKKVEKKEEKQLEKEDNYKNISNNKKIMKEEKKEEDKEENEERKNLNIFNDFEEDEEIRNIKTILDIIKNLDEGEGVSFDTIVEYSELSESKVNEIIQKLLSEGEIYEYLPGKYKVL